MTFTFTIPHVFLTAGFLLAGLENASPPAPTGSITLPPLFGDHMVLQRDIPIPIWGNGSPGAVVKVEFAGQTKSSEVQADGTWRVTLEPMPAGGPFDLIVSGDNTIEISDILIGEVWLGSGQSNMEMPLKSNWARVLRCEEEIAAADYPNIRLFQVEHAAADRPSRHITSNGWLPCSSATVTDFSAAMYFFGRELHNRLGIPVGLIQTTWSGTPIENWMSGDALFNDPEFREIVLNMTQENFTLEQFQALYESKVDAWREALRRQVSGLGADTRGWQVPEYDAEDWTPVELPREREETGSGLRQMVWLRKEVELAEEPTGDIILSLGPIHDFDITWFNGKEVGCTAGRRLIRNYSVPEDLIRPGRNVITVLALNIGHRNGLYGEPRQLHLKTAAGETLPLAGSWKCRVDPAEADAASLPAGPPSRANRPTVIFNAQIAPLVPYGMRGMLWYQGEANADRAYQYRRLFTTLITDWRAQWAQGDFPFLFVQLANWQRRQTRPTDDEWAELREAQQMALSLPNTGMAVAIDIGDADDIHPRNKQEVGRRLALDALHKVYGIDVPCSGPIFRAMHIDSDQVRLSFDHAERLSTPEGEPLQGFAVAGEDREFHWADARIEGESVVVNSPNVPRPLAVRYAWAANPIGNLYNGAALPTAPFRTDTWPGITVGNR